MTKLDNSSDIRQWLKSLNKKQLLSVVLAIFFAVICLVTFSSCSSVRAGYVRQRDIIQSDSTYLHLTFVETKSTFKSYNYGR